MNFASDFWRLSAGLYIEPIIHTLIKICPQPEPAMGCKDTCQNCFGSIPIPSSDAPQGWQQLTLLYVVAVVSLYPSLQYVKT